MVFIETIQPENNFDIVHESNNIGSEDCFENAKMKFKEIPFQKTSLMLFSTALPGQEMH